MSRWAVRQNLFRDGWGVYRVSPDGVSGVLWTRVSQWFDTWREAMDYADKRARTIEVTLPRNPLPLKIQGEEGDTDLVVEQKTKENGVSIKDEDQYDEIILRRFELRPLALALLALAEKERA